MLKEDLESTTKILAQIWSEVLQRSSEINPTDRLFEIGGDSVAMMMILFRVEKSLHVGLTPEQVFEDDSFLRMVRNIEELRTAAGAVPLEPQVCE